MSAQTLRDNSVLFIYASVFSVSGVGGGGGGGGGGRGGKGGQTNKAENLFP